MARRTRKTYPKDGRATCTLKLRDDIPEQAKVISWLARQKNKQAAVFDILLSYIEGEQGGGGVQPTEPRPHPPIIDFTPMLLALQGLREDIQEQPKRLAAEIVKQIPSSYPYLNEHVQQEEPTTREKQMLMEALAGMEDFATANPIRVRS